jgi:hypothetical protein
MRRFDLPTTSSGVMHGGKGLLDTSDIRGDVNDVSFQSHVAGWIEARVSSEGNVQSNKVSFHIS